MPPTDSNPVPGTRFRVRWVGEVDSTNTVVAAAAATGEPEGLVVSADHQTAGRGRLGRSWVAPPGTALLISILLRPPTPDLHLAVTAVACAAAAACRRLTGVEPRLKWPNDLVVGVDGDWRKLGGVLAEASASGGTVTAVVAGLGVNVRRPAGLPADLAATAVSLDQLTAQVPERHALLTAILEELETRYRALRTGEGAADLLGEYRARCVTIGQVVRVDRSLGTFEGRAVGIDDDGALVVDLGGGRTVVVDTGDVVQLRPA